MKRALLSVTEKTGVAKFAQGLVEQGFELVSTGGTAVALKEAGLQVQDVASVTGFPEMLDGRVKTLHPLIHGGLLGDTRQASHATQMSEAGIQPIELLCVNLYAFEATVSKPHTLEEAIESIDIGGPAMIRAASKNWHNVTVVVDPSDYPTVLEAIADGKVQELRQSLAAKAFRHTAYYDSVISRYLSGLDASTPFPETLTFGYRKGNALRYGENPHQPASVYSDPLGSPGVLQARQLWGKELSFNNYYDAQAAWELVCDMPANACAIIKHSNPCGAAAAGSFAESYRQARAADPVSAFGGIAAFNGEVDVAAAEAMTDKGNFLEVVIATQFSPEAMELFQKRAGWGQDVRLLAAPLAPTDHRLTQKVIRGGTLVQIVDEEPAGAWTVATTLAPTDDQMAALKFLWSLIPHVKSNAIIVGDSTRLLGVGAGQMNRVRSVRLALEQAGELAEGAALASDAFFPFPDSVETAAKAGIKAIIQPGGSKKDGEVVAAANDLGLAMVLTGVRHFLH